MSHRVALLVATLLLGACAACRVGAAGSPASPWAAEKAVVQQSLPLIERMPAVPHPFHLLDWRARARGFDRLAFDLSQRGPHLPLVTLVDRPLAIAGAGFALPSYVGGQPHRGEGICCLAALVGGSLAGVDKTSQFGRDWARMGQEWFNPGQGQGVVLNGPGARSGGSFWYEVFPSLLFYELADRYPRLPGEARVLRSTADRWRDVCAALRGPDGRADFNWTAFDLARMQPVFNGRWREPDAAAGIGWIEYMAWRRWHDPAHREAARWCLDFLQRRPAAEGSPLYEILLYYGPVLAARFNAEEGAAYDVAKLMGWCFSENRQAGVPRRGWGIIAGRFGGYDCYGLQGSTTDTDGYAFAMNTFQAAAAVAPLPRYDARYARAVGRWLLNLANAARLFYPDALPTDLQSSPGWHTDPPDVVCYEGLRHHALVAPQPVRQQRRQGRVEGSLFHVTSETPLALTADAQGRLCYEASLALPPGAAAVPFHFEARTTAAAESFIISGSFQSDGPWEPLVRFPRRGAADQGRQHAGGVLSDAQGHGQIYLRVTAADTAQPAAQLRIDRWAWRIELPRGPFATGDAQIPSAGTVTDLAMYGAAHVGFLAALVDPTDQPHVVRWDLLATDFFHGPAWPTFLYYNPETAARTVKVDVGPAAVDVYETTTHRFLARHVTGAYRLAIPADQAQVIVLPPAGKPEQHRGRQFCIDGVTMDFGCE